MWIYEDFFSNSFDSFNNKWSSKYCKSHVDITRISINSKQLKKKNKQVPVNDDIFVLLLFSASFSMNVCMIFCLLFSKMPKKCLHSYVMDVKENPCQTWVQPMDQCSKSAFVYCFAFSSVFFLLVYSKGIKI